MPRLRPATIVATSADGKRQTPRRRQAALVGYDPSSLRAPTELLRKAQPKAKRVVDGLLDIDQAADVIDLPAAILRRWVVSRPAFLPRTCSSTVSRSSTRVT